MPQATLGDIISDPQPLLSTLCM